VVNQETSRPGAGFFFGRGAVRLFFFDVGALRGMSSNIDATGTPNIWQI